MNNLFWERVRDARIYLTTLIVLITVLLLLLYLFPTAGHVTVQYPELESLKTPPPPAFTEETQKKLEMFGRFDALISYTDGGFAPPSITISSGQTLRFTNNSSSAIWIAAGDTPESRYPGGDSGCSSSKLDSCGPIATQDFWQFTFTEPGTWKVVNNVDKSKELIVVVQ